MILPTVTNFFYSLSPKLEQEGLKIIFKFIVNDVTSSPTKTNYRNESTPTICPLLIQHYSTLSTVPSNSTSSVLVHMNPIPSRVSACMYIRYHYELTSGACSWCMHIPLRFTHSLYRIYLAYHSHIQTADRTETEQFFPALRPLVKAI